MFLSFRYPSLSSLNLLGDGNVLLLWGAHNQPEFVKDTVNVLKQKVGDGGHIQVENTDRLILCKFYEANFFMLTQHSSPILINFESL